MFYVNNKNVKHVFLYELPQSHVFYHKGNVPYTIDVASGGLIRGEDTFVLHGTFVDTNQKFTVDIGNGGEPDVEYGFYVDCGGDPYVTIPDNDIQPRIAYAGDKCIDKNGERWDIVRTWRNSILLSNEEFTKANIITADELGEYFDVSMHESLCWVDTEETFYVVDMIDADPTTVPENINRLGDCVIKATMTADGKLHVGKVFARNVETYAFDDEYVEVDLVLEGESMFQYIRLNMGGWL